MAASYHKRVGNYIFLGPIGRGAFAEVYKGIHQTTHEDVAIKMMSRARVKDEEAHIEKEIRILRELNHTNIVRFLDYQKTQNHYYLIFEFCKHGDLEHFIREFYNGRVPEFEAQKFVQQIIEGIKAMKAKNIVHRDLKLANILVSKDFILKIADFGLARYLEKDDFLLKTMVGTPLNMDPNILERKGYSEKCDIWSLGVIFYQILVGKPPFNPGRGAGIEDLLALIKKQPVIFPTDIPLSDSVKQLIKSMLVYDVNKRISFEDLFQHEWVTGKYEIPDPNKVVSQIDLSATQLLQSMYDKKKSEKKEKNRTKSIPTEKELAPTGKVEVPGEDKVENARVKTVDYMNATELEKERELYGAAFLAKSYEIFRDKIYKLREYIMKIKNMRIPNDLFDDERVSIIQILLSMDLLKLLGEILSFKFGIINEENEEIIFNNDFKTFWQRIMENKEVIENFFCTDDIALEITDLYEQVRTDYVEIYEDIHNKLEGLRDTFERFKGFNLEKLIMDCLIQLSENSAYQEYLEEKLESKIDKYNTCYQICEFLVFRNNFKFTHFKIIKRNSDGKEESKDQEDNDLFNFVPELFQTDFAFNFLKQMSQKDEYKKRFAQIKNSVVISDSENTAPSELEYALRKFQVLVSKRIDDLKEKIEIDFSS